MYEVALPRYVPLKCPHDRVLNRQTPVVSRHLRGKEISKMIEASGGHLGTRCSRRRHGVAAEAKERRMKKGANAVSMRHIE